MKQFFRQKTSFTLIELLIFTTLISFIFITLSYLVAKSLYLTRVAEHKLLATHYAEELREFLRGQKEMDWGSFKSPIDAQPTNQLAVCYATSPIPQGSGTGGVVCGGNDCTTDLSCAYALGDPPNKIFKRYATLNFQDLGDADSTNDRIEFAVTVAWNEGGNSFTVPLNGAFTQLE